MHWSEEIARKIIERNPGKAEYVCAAGISPSGSIHIGNFRDVATSFFVVQSLRKLGKKARLLFSWDEYDRLRKVPKNVADIAPDMNKKMERYIGCPYVDVPNPFGDDAANYAVYFEREFEDAIRRFGLELDFRHQAEMYRSGKYREQILLALKKRKEIFDIIDSHRTQDAAEVDKIPTIQELMEQMPDLPTSAQLVDYKNAEANDMTLKVMTSPVTMFRIIAQNGHQLST